MFWRGIMQTKDCPAYTLLLTSHGFVCDLRLPAVTSVPSHIRPLAVHFPAGAHVPVSKAHVPSALRATPATTAGLPGTNTSIGALLLAAGLAAASAVAVMVVLRARGQNHVD